MSLWKRAMDYLGLGPDDPYDDYDAPEPEPARATRSSRPAPVPEPDPRNRPRPVEDDMVTRPNPTRTNPTQGLEPVPPRRTQQMDPGDQSGVTVRQPNRPTPQGSTVRVQPPAAPEPATVRPRSFNQAQEVADRFKEGLPVIMNLEATERDVARRLIDFASGLCYALDGSMEKVATGVYLLKPTGRPSYTDEYGG